MKLYEYEAEEIVEAEGVQIPRRVVVKTPTEAVEAFRRMGGSVMVKAQILASGRGKAGGILPAESEGEVEEAARRLLDSSIMGIPVKSLLIQERIEAVRELYLGIAIDRAARRPVTLASTIGGVDIEEVAAAHPEEVFREHIDPLEDLDMNRVGELGSRMGLSGRAAADFRTLLQSLYRIFREMDCELIETNPIAVTKGGELVPLDVRMIVDDNALYRHSELRRRSEELTDLEAEAAERGVSFVELDGDLGVVGNGAGLVMATLDMLSYFKGRPADFCDVGGGAEAGRVKEAVNVVLKNPKVKAVLVNILGGITRCSEVAEGLVRALKATGLRVPVVVRLAGTGEEEGLKILDQAGVRHLEMMEGASMEAVKLTQGVS